MISNTPLQWVVDYGTRQDTLAFQVDLWSARGELPGNLAEVAIAPEGNPVFQPDPRQHRQVQRGSGSALRARASAGAGYRHELRDSEDGKLLSTAADHKVYSIVHLIYRSRHYEGHSKDYEFSRLSMEDHWRAGYHDTVRTLRHREVLIVRATGGRRAFDLAYDGRE